MTHVFSSRLSTRLQDRRLLDNQVALPAPALETDNTLASPNGMLHTAPLASPLAGAHARTRARIQNLVRRRAQMPV